MERRRRAYEGIAGFVDHTDREPVQPLKIHRSVLHLQIDVVNVGAGQGAGVFQGQIARLEMNGLPAASLSMTGLRCFGAC
jgi:hypothetical protein